MKILLYACFKYCTNYIVYRVKSVSKSIFSKNLSYFMNPLFIHKQHIYLECTTTLNDREDLHLLYNSVTQMSSLNVQGYKNTAGASACREVSCRFLHGFCVLNRCLLEKPQDNLLWKSAEVRGITLLGQIIHTVWKFLGFPKKTTTRNHHSKQIWCNFSHSVLY